MNNNKQCIKVNETAQEFHECINDTCPICNEKITNPIDMQKIGLMTCHLNCYLELTNETL